MGSSILYGGNMATSCELRIELIRAAVSELQNKIYEMDAGLPLNESEWRAVIQELARIKGVRL